MTTRVFRTRRGRITLTDQTLINEEKGEPQRRVRVLRADISDVRIVTYAYWRMPVRIDALIHHRRGLLTIPRVGRRTAEALRAALGF
jgi:hypothetical protein